MHEHYEWCVSIKHLRSIKKVILDTFKEHPAIKYLICHTLTFKGTVHLTIKNARFHCFGVAEFWGHQYRDFCSLSSITGPDHTLKAQKKKKNLWKTSAAMSLFRNHDPVTKDNPQILLWAVLCEKHQKETCSWQCGKHKWRPPRLSCDVS